MKLPHKKIRAYVNSASYSIRNVNVVTLFSGPIRAVVVVVVDGGSKIENVIGGWQKCLLKQIPESIANFHNKIASITCI